MWGLVITNLNYPQDNSTPTNLLIVIDGDGVKTAGFGILSVTLISAIFIIHKLQSFRLHRFPVGKEAVSRVSQLMPRMPLLFLFQIYLLVSITTQVQERLWESRKSEAHPRLQLQLQILSHRLISHMNCESLTH